MALLTPSSGSVVPDSVPPRSKEWRRVEDGQKTDPCHCHSDLILGPFPGPSHICRSGMASMDQRKWLVGFQPVPSWTGLLHLFLLYPPLPSYFTILSGSGNLEGIQLSLLISQFCLHCFKCLWQAAKFAYTDILIKLVLDATSFYWSSCGTLAHSCGELPHPVMYKQNDPSSVSAPLQPYPYDEETFKACEKKQGF